MKELIPYIGVTGITNFREIKDLLYEFIINRSSDRPIRLHNGVMMSWSRLNNRPQEYGWEQSIVSPNILFSLFELRSVYNCLHYADPQNRDLERNLCNAILCEAGVGIDALQLDLHWPNPVSIANAVHNSRRNIEVILQVGKKVFREASGDHSIVVDRLKDYEGIIHRVLLDQSMGNGIPMDIETTLHCALAVRKTFPNWGIVVAGGLGPGRMDPIREILKEIPDVSWDAQGKISQGEDSRNPLDMDYSRQYLIESLALLK